MQITYYNSPMMHIYISLNIISFILILTLSLSSHLLQVRYRVNRESRLDLPTPLSPINTTMYIDNIIHYK